MIDSEAVGALDGEGDDVAPVLDQDRVLAASDSAAWVPPNTLAMHLLLTQIPWSCLLWTMLVQRQAETLDCLIRQCRKGTAVPTESGEVGGGGRFG